MKLKLGLTASLYKEDDNGQTKTFSSANHNFDLKAEKSSLLLIIEDWLVDFLLDCKNQMILDLNLTQSDIDEALKGK